MPHPNRRLSMVLTGGAAAAAALLVMAGTAHFLPLGVLIQGAVLGTLYSLLAMALILVYQGNRIINFAGAGLGAVPAAAGVTLLTRSGLPYPVIALVVVGAAAALGAIIERVIIRRFLAGPPLVLTVVTIGLAEVLAFLEVQTPVWLGGRMQVAVTVVRTPLTGRDWSIAGVQLTGSEVFTAAAVLLTVGGFVWLWNRTPLGLGIRAAIDNRDRAATLGVPVEILLTAVWAVAAVLAAIAIFLRAPLTGMTLGSATGPEVLLYALTAAVLARMRSLGRAFVAGLGVGVVDEIAFYSSRRSTLSDAIMLGVILVSLALQRSDRLRGDSDGSWRSASEMTGRGQARRSRPTRSGWAVRLAWIMAAMAALLAPWLVGVGRLELLTVILIFAMVGVSLVLLTGWAGQVSLGQFAIVGVGAAVAGDLAVRHHGDFFLAVLAAGLAGAACAVIIGLPALRFQGLFLAVTTLAFAFTVQSTVLNREYFGWLLPPAGSHIDRPVLYGVFDTTSDFRYYYVCLAFLAGAAWLTSGVRHRRSGRLFVAARDNERAVQSLGVNLARTRLAAFALSGFLAASAGALLAYQQGAVDPLVYGPTESLQVFAMTVIGGIASVPGALIGAVYVQGIRYLAPTYALLATGAGLLALLTLLPGGLIVGLERVVGFVAEFMARGTRSAEKTSPPIGGRSGSDSRRRGVRSRWRAPSGRRRTATPGANGSDPLLQIRGINAGYGGLQVLFGIDLEIPSGQIVALLGTNGAGKSTLLRVVSGLLAPAEGSVEFCGVDVTRLRPQQLAAEGVALMPGGRGTFPDLTVAENLRVACWRRLPDGRSAAERVRAAVEGFPALDRLKGRRARSLSGGEQQMLALAMAFACRPRLLLIDELSLGLAPAIVADLLQVVRSFVGPDTAVLFVEQSTNVALALADTAYFLERGEVRFSGLASDLAGRSDLLRAVFLTDGRRRAAVTPSAAARTSGGAKGRAGEADSLLVLDQIRKDFGGVAAVDNVELELLEGEILGLIGPNGAGKTTVFDLVSGFSKPDRGRVVLRGIDVTDWSADRRARAGLGRSTQEGRLFPSLTVAENLAVALERHLEVRDHLASFLALPLAVCQEDDIAYTVDELIGMFGLGDLRDALAGTLSTGSRRVVDIGMAMAHSPRVLLLDEPAAGLAQAEVESLTGLLSQLRVEVGCSVVLIEHDMPLISTVCDRIAAMALGRVLTIGPPRDVLEHPDVVRSYLGADQVTVGRSDAVAAAASPRRRGGAGPGDPGERSANSVPTAVGRKPGRP